MSRGATRPRKIDWERVRREYETTNVSLRALADRWGLSSETSIRRRRDVEGWTRDVQAIAARLLTAAVARGDGAEDAIEGENGPEPVVVRASRGKSAGRACAQNPAQAPEDAEEIAPDVRSGVRTPPAPRVRTSGQASALPELPPLAPMSQSSVMSELRDAQDLSTATDLANTHARRTFDQLAYADRLLAMALPFLGHLGTIASSTDEAEVSNARARVQAINGEKDTLSKVADTMVKAVQVAVAMQRRALSMDAINGGPEPGPAAASQRPMQEVLKRMEPGSRMDLRRATLEASRLPPPVPDAA